MRKAVLFALGAAALVLDPIGACTGGFSFGEPEMRAAVEGTWDATVAGEHYTLEVRELDRLVQASRSWVPTAAACGSRSFVRLAGACVDVSRLPLAVKVVSGPHVETKGELMVAGSTFTAGQLSLTLGSVTLDAMVMPDGTVKDGIAGYSEHGLVPGPIALARTAH